MLGLLALINIASFIAFVVGLINPKLVLRGDKRTRLRTLCRQIRILLQIFHRTEQLAIWRNPPDRTNALYGNFL
ncbi:MAG: hypothetical protein KME52_18465 [Desmonostoc geniculatum HA4340-LM1]|nr:hypothetical protein [Desmonostoc geniculatum HA4340-LM1]